MLKKITLAFTIAFAIHSVAQVQGPLDDPNKKVTIGKAIITGQIVGAENQKIYFGNQNLGGVQKPLTFVNADDEGKFSLEYDLPFADYYYLKFHNNQLLNLILHGNDTIKIYGDLKDILSLSNFVGSEESEVMNQFLVGFSQFKKVEDSLRRVVQIDPTKQLEVNNFFKPFAEGFYAKRNKFINMYSKTPAIVVAVNAIDQDAEWALYKSVVDLLKESYGHSPTIQNIVKFVENKEKEKEAKKFLEPGHLAKEIALPNTEGDTIRLSDLRGKVVLIDFWASWCKPCRMENPNVVNMYSKYKEDGFTVYSVSLDNDAARWKTAIAQDGLVWPNHVSDLKKWASAAAADYVVRGIPFTVLVDQEGKIIGSNIRGADLQNQLKAIFGH